MNPAKIPGRETAPAVNLDDTGYCIMVALLENFLCKKKEGQGTIALDRTKSCRT